MFTIDISKYISCGYFRVSRTDTAEDKLAVRKYRQQLIAAGVSEVDIFYDFDSGNKRDRANYQKMLKLVRNQKYNLVVVPVQNRLNRNVLNSELLIEDIINAEAKILDLAAGQIIDPQNKNDLLSYRFKAVIDNHKLEEIKSNSADNHAYKRSKKETSTVPFGYTIVRRKAKLDKNPFVCLLSNRPETLPSVDFETPYNWFAISPAEVLRELIDFIFVEKNITNAVKKIHNKYGIEDYIPDQKDHRPKVIYKLYNDSLLKYRKPLHFTHRGVKTLISNPLLQGDLAYFYRDLNRETIIYPGELIDEAIVSRNEWQQLQLLKSSPVNRAAPKDRYPYIGKIYCSYCKTKLLSRQGYKSVKNPERPRKKSYYCRNSGKGCPCKAIAQSEIDKIVFPQLIERYREIAIVGNESEEIIKSPELVKLQHQLASLKSLPQNPTIARAIVETEKDIKRERLNQSTKCADQEDSIAILESVFANPLYWETLTDVEKWEINQYLIKRIEIAVDGKKSYVKLVDLLV